MEVWKKNLVALGLLITVCTGIYLNWLYSGGGKTPDLVDTLSAGEIQGEDLEVLGDNLEDPENTMTNYFAAVRLSRQQARDSAVSTLQEAMAYGDEEENISSSQQLEQIIQTALSEAQIESLVLAQGYADCVAYLSESGISVAVAAPEGGLQKSDVALIADIVMSQCDLTMPDIRVVEVQ